MAKNKTQSGTSIQHVKQQNAQASSGAGQYGTEFASQTNVAQVQKQNAKSASSSANAGQYGTEFASQTAKKAQNSGSYGQNSQQ